MARLSHSASLFPQHPHPQYYNAAFAMEVATAMPQHPPQPLPQHHHVPQQHQRPQQQLPAPPPAPVQQQPSQQQSPMQPQPQPQQSSAQPAEPMKRKRGRPRLNITDQERAERAKQQQAAWRKEYKRRRQEREAQVKARHEDGGDGSAHNHQAQQQHSMYAPQQVGASSPFFGAGQLGKNHVTMPFIHNFNGISSNSTSNTPRPQQHRITAQDLVGTPSSASPSGLMMNSSGSGGGLSSHHSQQQQGTDPDEVLPQWQDIDVNLPVAGDLVVRTETAEFSWHGKMPGRLKVSFIPDEAAAAQFTAAAAAADRQQNPSGTNGSAGAVGSGADGGDGGPSPSWRSVNSSD